MAKNKRVLKRVLLYLTVILTCLILGFPMYWMFNTSITPQNDTFLYPPQLVNPNPTLDAYANIIAERPIVQWMANSFYLVLLVLGATILTAIFAGYALSRYRNRGTKIVGVFLLASRMLPTTLLVIPLFVVMRVLKLTDTLYSVALADLVFVVPFTAWMLKGYFDSISRELEEAAWIDGCSRFQSLVQIIIPLAAPGIAASLLFGAILTWDDFIFARTFITSQSNWTVTVGLSSFKGEYVTYWNQIMAASFIGTIPIVVVFSFVERYMIGGLTAGALKG
jgi:multiple sugar transport system permease protein